MDNDEWETIVIHNSSENLPSPQINNLINMEVKRQAIIDWDDDEDAIDNTRVPPVIDPAMFPGLIGDIVTLCCSNSEASPIAVALNSLVYIASLIGPTVYMPLGDEQRLLNLFVLMVGPSGLGKGTSLKPVDRLFQRVEECLAEDLHQQFNEGLSEGICIYPSLAIHRGGLSSGEGLLEAISDNNEPPVLDKRLLIIEPEFGSVMTMAQRSGNNLSSILRNSFDSQTIKPLTRHNKICVTDPYLCMIGHITGRELTCHSESDMMAANGLLNRFFLVWQQMHRIVPFPDSIDNDAMDSLARRIAASIIEARQSSHETSYRKMKACRRPMGIDDQAKSVWEPYYRSIMDSADCDAVATLTRRRRLYGRLFSGLFALSDGRMTVNADDMKAAIAWCEYHRQSVIYIFRKTVDQRHAEKIDDFSKRVLFAINHIFNNKTHCTTTDLYRFFNNKKITAGHFRQSLERLLCHIPPLIHQNKLFNKQGPPTFFYQLTSQGMTMLPTTQGGTND